MGGSSPAAAARRTSAGKVGGSCSGNSIASPTSSTLASSGSASSRDARAAASWAEPHRHRSSPMLRGIRTEPNPRTESSSKGGHRASAA
eukprot:scaffold17559_cov110-Isochrysis_galbana.AAC.6